MNGKFGAADYRASTPSSFASLGIPTPSMGFTQPMQTPMQTPIQDSQATQSERFYTHNQREAMAEKLQMRLAPECISQRPAPGGGKVSYIEGAQAIALANSIFGYDGWSSQIMSNTTEYLEQANNGKFQCCISTVVRITVFTTGAFHEDVGIGEIMNCPTRASAIDKCRKEAVTDAVKRCLRYFGNSTGNCLYDKDYSKEIIKHKDKNKYRYDPDQLYRPPEFDYRPNHVREQEALRREQHRQQQQHLQQQQHEQIQMQVNAQAQQQVKQERQQMNGGAYTSNGTAPAPSVSSVKDEDLIWDGYEMNDASDTSMLDDKSLADVTVDSNGTSVDRDDKSALMPPPALPGNHRQPQQQPPPQQQQPQQQQQQQQQPQPPQQSSPFSSPKKNKGAESRAAALKRGRESTMITEKSPHDDSTLKRSKT